MLLFVCKRLHVVSVYNFQTSTKFVYLFIYLFVYQTVPELNWCCFCCLSWMMILLLKLLFPVILLPQFVFCIFHSLTLTFAFKLPRGASSEDFFLKNKTLCAKNLLKNKCAHVTFETRSFRKCFPISFICAERWKSLLLKSYRKVILWMWLWLNRI